MSWNIQTPGDYINGPLTVAGVAQFNSNVGIGIASPSYRLDVSSATASNQFRISGSNQNSITLGNAAGTGGTGFLLGRSFSSDNANNFFVYDIASSALRFFIGDTGYVGLGTASPGYKLVIQSPSGGQMQFENSSDSNRGGRISSTGASGTGKFSIATTSSGYGISFGIDSIEKMLLDTGGSLLLGTPTSPTGTKIGSIAKLGTVSVEGTNYINVSTTPVALARSIGTGALFFVAGYNTTGGAQGWWLVASTGASVATVIASGNNTLLTVAFTQVSGVLNMNTTSGTVAVTAFSITN